MADRILEIVPELDDLGLALLVSMIAEEHCIFSTSLPERQQLQDELSLACVETFGTHPAVIQCSPATTVDQFNEAILVEDDETYEDAVERHGDHYARSPPVRLPSMNASRGPARDDGISKSLDDRKVADIIIAQDLDLATQAVQVQVIELIRSRRIFTRTSMHTAPKDLLFVAITSEPGRKLSHHLNDLFAISHVHAVDDDLPRTDTRPVDSSPPQITREDITALRIQADQCRLTAEIAQYLHNVVVFMRMSRYVKGGVTATATRHFRAIAKTLAPLHGLDFVTPSFVALAARKIYPHRLKLASPETEMSLQWGSTPEALRQLYDGLTVEDVIEDVIADVPTPL